MSELEPTRTYSNPTATVKLLPCPFCGYMPQVSSYEYHLPSGKIYGTQWKVECMDDNCPAQPTVDWHYFTREEAIAAWNRRAE